MSQHPSFPPHIPRGAVAASALTIPKNAATAVLRAGTSPAIQIPAAPSVPSVSVSVGGVGGLPAALARNPVISAIRPATLSSTCQPSSLVSVPEHPRTNLIVQGAAGGGAPLSGPPLQITLTQRGGALGLPEAMKLTPLGGAKTLTVPQPALVQHQKVAVGTQPGPGSMMGMMSHLQHLAVSKPAGLQVSASVPAISISSLSSMPTATVVAPASTAIPIAKVTPQRQQMPLTSGLPSSMAMSSGSEFSGVPELGMAATQAGASQLLLSRGQAGAVVSATTGVSLATSIPSAGSLAPHHGDRASQLLMSRSQAGGAVSATTGVSLATSIPTAGSLAPHHGDRALPAGTMFNLTGAGGNVGGQGGQEMWLSQLFYQQAVARGHQQLVASPAVQTPQPIVRSNTNTFFVPRPGVDQTKITAQTPNLAASLSHQLAPAQPMLFNTHHVMVDGLRQPLPLGGAVVSTMATTMGVHSENKPVISLSAGGGQPTLHASLIAASTAATSHSDLSAFPSSSSLHMAANLASGTTCASLPHLGLSAMASRATVASSIIAAASAHQAQTAATLQPQAPGTPGGSSNLNANSSPRPSILRKRHADGNTTLPRKPNFNLMAESHSPRPDTAPLSNISSPKTPATENSQSSTDTALSSNDANTPTHNSHGDVKVKIEPADGIENGPAVASPAISLAGSNADASPRKRARKQLFDTHRNVNEEVKDSSTDDDLDSRTLIKDIIKHEHPLEHRDEFIDGEGVRWTRERTKPSMSIMSDYSVNWKPKYNHFQRHSDVRPKDDRNPTVNELISQRGILQKASGWKLYYVSAQVEDVIENEQNMEERMEKLKERIAATAATHTASEHDYNKLLELTRGNLQRCQVVRQQMLEAKTNMLNILKHEPKIKEIIHKNLAKRTIKKKERS